METEGKAGVYKELALIELEQLSKQQGQAIFFLFSNGGSSITIANFLQKLVWLKLFYMFSNTDVAVNKL